jgi:hypothetical protein
MRKLWTNLTNFTNLTNVTNGNKSGHGTGDADSTASDEFPSPVRAVAHVHLRS